MKKYVIVLVVTLILVGVLTGYLTFKSLKENIISESEAIANSVIDLYKGNESFRNNSEISEELVLEIENYLAELKETDNLEYEIDITPLEIYDQEAPPEEVDPDAPIQIELSEYDDDDEIVTDKENTHTIYKKDSNTIAIKVNDLEFSDIGYSEVIYDGVIYSIYLQDIPATYQRIQNSPEYVFKYVETVVVGKDVKVYYKSILTDKILCVIVSNNGVKPTYFKVK